MSDIDSMEIALGFTVGDWKKLNLEDPTSKNWEKAIYVFESRINSRFIEPADILIDAHKRDSSKKVGFAVLTLDFIVIETIQGFREGHIKHTKKNTEGKEYPISSPLIKTFLTDEPSFKLFFKTREYAKDIYDAVRCNIAHMGQTAAAVRVNIDYDIMIHRDDDSKIVTINRNLFHKATIDAFERYRDELKDMRKNRLRDNFLKKMNYICGITESS